MTISNREKHFGMRLSLQILLATLLLSKIQTRSDPFSGPPVADTGESFEDVGLPPISSIDAANENQIPESEMMSQAEALEEIENRNFGNSGYPRDPKIKVFDLEHKPIIHENVELRPLEMESFDDFAMQGSTTADSGLVSFEIEQNSTNDQLIKLPENSEHEQLINDLENQLKENLEIHDSGFKSFENLATDKTKNAAPQIETTNLQIGTVPVSKRIAPKLILPSNVAIEMIEPTVIQIEPEVIRKVDTATGVATASLPTFESIPRPTPIPFPPPQPEPEIQESELVDVVESYSNFLKNEIYMTKNDADPDFSLAPPGMTLSTDKPVYRPGETVRIQIYFFDKFSKAPKEIDRVLLASNPRIIINDGNKKKKAEITAYNRREFVLYFEYDLEEDVAGGFYSLEFKNDEYHLVPTKSIFVMNFQSQREVVLLETDRDVVAPNDLVRASAQLKVLGKEVSPADISGLKVSFIISMTNSQEKVVKETVTDATGLAEIEMRVPKTDQNQDESPGYVIQARIWFEGKAVKASKELSSVKLSEVRVEATPGSGKWVMGLENQIYFKTKIGWNDDREFVFDNAELLRKKKNSWGDVMPTGIFISSDKNGAGRFSLKIEEGFEYGLRLRVPKEKPRQMKSNSGLFTRDDKESDSEVDYFSLSPEDQYKIDYEENRVRDVRLDGYNSWVSRWSHSQFLLSVSNRILNQDQELGITIEKSSVKVEEDRHNRRRRFGDSKNKNGVESGEEEESKEPANMLWLVIQDKTRILLEKKVEFDGEKFNMEMPVEELDLPNGGVVTIQLMPDDNIESPIQEFLMYVHPKTKLDFNVRLDKEIYAPEEIAHMQIIRAAPKSEKILWGVVVTDENSFSKISQKRQMSSMVSQIFLEYELEFNNKNRQFYHSQQYIDGFFLNNYAPKSEDDPLGVDPEVRNQKLDLLLGIQKWRKDFLSQQNLKNFVRYNRSSRGSYVAKKEYLLGRSLDHLIELREDPKNKKKRKELQEKLRRKTKRRSVSFGARGGMVSNDLMDDGGEVEEMAFSSAPAPRMAKMNLSSTSVSFAQMDSSSENESLLGGNPPEDEFETDKGVSDSETLEISDEELRKQIQKDTILYSTLGDSIFEDGMLFKLPKRVGKFRVTVVGVSASGVYGMFQTDFQVQRPFNASIDTPLFIRGEDKLTLTLTVENNTKYNKTFEILPFNTTVKVDGNSSSRIPIELNSNEVPQKLLIRESYNRSNSMALVLNPEVYKGYSQHKSQSLALIQKASDAPASENLTLPLPSAIIDNKVRVEVNYQPWGPGLLLSSMKELVREPTGCFEQTSSKTFPMVLLLQYFQSQKQLFDPKITDNQKVTQMTKIKKDIEQKLEKGVRRLLSFETTTGGFDWFGRAPGNPRLTAYGLWQFMEMNETGPWVDQKVVKRTLNWLRDLYKKSSNSFSETSHLTNITSKNIRYSDVYIVFVLSLFKDLDEGFTSIIDTVMEAYEEDLFETKDSATLSYMGMIYLNRGEKEKAKKAADLLVKNFIASTGKLTRSNNYSLTRSWGRGLEIETSALAVIFLAQFDPDTYWTSISDAMRYIQENMANGFCYSTQATVLGLKALSLYSSLSKPPARKSLAFRISVGGLSEDVSIDLNSNGAELEGASFDIDLSQDMGSENQMNGLPVKITSLDQMGPSERHIFSAVWDYRVPQLFDAEESPLKLEVSRQENSNVETISLSVENTGDKNGGMMVTVINLPSYIRVNLNDLETLRNSGKVEYYELRKNNSEMVLYWSYFWSHRKVDLDVSLLHVLPFSSESGVAVSSYMYYDKDSTIVHQMV